MAAEKGRAMVLQVGDGLTAETFTAIGGARTHGITLNGEIVDVTDKDDAGVRQLLADAGVRSASISIAGIFKDSAAEKTLQNNYLQQSIDNYRLVFESGDFFSGGFQIASLEYTGEHNGARQYTATLESSGTVGFTP